MDPDKIRDLSSQMQRLLMSEIVIFEGGSQSVEVRLEGESLWLSLQQIADLFGRDKSVISRHLRNVFTTEELEREAVVAKKATTAADGKIYRVEWACPITPDRLFNLTSRRLELHGADVSQR